MRRGIYVVCGVVAFLVIGALITELAIKHVDTGPLITYMATVIVPLVPIFFMLFQQRKTLPAIQEVATQAAEHAATAADRATKAENNTNGAMTNQFENIRLGLEKVAAKINAHIEDDHGRVMK